MSASQHVPKLFDLILARIFGLNTEHLLYLVVPEEGPLALYRHEDSWLETKGERGNEWVWKEQIPVEETSVQVLWSS